MSMLGGYIKVYGWLGLAARNGKAGGAWRLWTYARALDETARGHICAEDLASELEQFDLSPRTIRRWRAQAKKRGLVWNWGERLHYASLERAGLILGAERVGRAVLLPRHALAEAGWASWTWAAFVEGNIRPGRPISRHTLRELSSIPERTQQEWDRARSDVITKKQQYGLRHAQEGMSAEDFVNATREFAARSGAFLMLGEGGQNRRVAWPLPNVYWTNLQRCPVGQSRKIDRKLAPVDFEATGHARRRLFFASAKGALKSIRCIRAGPYSGTRTRFLEGDHDGWSVCFSGQKLPALTRVREGTDDMATI
jgi:hypothetical protein